MALRIAALVVIAVFGASSCDRASQEKTIVAAVYPLAFAAERIAGPEWTVIDLTPPGVEAHDLELTLRQRASIEEAAVVMYVGDFGFQPQVEAAVENASGHVIEATLDGGLRVIGDDPHLWLDAVYMSHIAEHLAGVLGELDPDASQDYIERNGPLSARLFDLADRYVAGLSDCEYRTMLVPHEAFAYVAAAGTGIRQFGLSDITPDAEPSAARLAEARRLVESGETGALFYEARGEDPEADRALASDLGIPALPIDTLESQPPEGDYFTVMEDNLESLREGLRCR